MDANKLIEHLNIASELKEDQLLEIGNKVVAGFNADDESRQEWLTKVNTWMELALQITDQKTFPWAQAANVKYPLMTIAALQFQARAYPSLVNTSGLLVKGEVIGQDMDGTKNEQATRVAQHMSYQILNDLQNDWEEDMDKMLLQLPIIGCAFKKTYYDPVTLRNCSHLISAKDLVVDYYSKSLEEAHRITHILYLNKNKIISRINANIYSDVDLGEPNSDYISPSHENPGELRMEQNNDFMDIPYTILEQHTWLDLDEDGYEEPYIVTVDYATKQVLRIVARYSEEDVLRDKDGTTIEITPKEYFTKFGFIPNPDGGFYDVGFGLLLGSINDSANTLINQLIDAGTLSNLQSGFLARGVRIKGGSFSFRPGEWKVVNSTGDDLKKGIFPMPVREPSNVLFTLLTTLLQAGRDVMSIQDINVGKMPGQNTPATTTMASIQEGQKIFTSIYKRIYRSLKKEFTKLFELNKKYMPTDYEYQVLGIPKPPYIQTNDYQQADFRIMPAADPNVASDEAKQQRAAALMQLIPTGLINPQLAIKMLLESQQQPNIEGLMQVQPPGPPPELQIKQMELQYEDKWKQMEYETKMAAVQAQLMTAKSTSILNIAKAESETQNSEITRLQADLEMLMQQNDHSMQQKQMMHDMQMAQQGHEQSMEAGDQKMRLDMIKAILDNSRKEKAAEVKAKAKKGE